MNPQKPLTLADLQAHFPTSGKFHNGPWVGQTQIMEFVASHGSAIVESPTGSGKTAVEYAVAQAAAQKMGGPVYIITPNKTLVEQIHAEFPEVKVVYGQNEYPCPWAAENFEQEPAQRVTLLQLPVLAEDPNIPRVNEIPHLLHKRCPHYVDQTTGDTLVQGAVPCPYYQQKYAAKQGGVVLSTMSFYLFAHLFGGHELPSALVIDECHRIADVLRYSLSYDITDWHLEQALVLLERMDDVSDEIEVLAKFLKALKRIAKAKRRQPLEETLLEEDEIRRLMEILQEMDAEALLRKIEAAVAAGIINPVEDRVVLKKLETLVRDVRRYIHSFEYSLEERNEQDEVTRKPLNYTCAFYKQEKGERDRVQYRLVIRCHYVAPLIKKRLLAPFTVSFSATVGDPEIFGYETGITDPFLELGSNFPATNTRLYMPTDTPNLAMNSRSRQDLTKSLRKIAKACVRFARKGHRSLVVVISNAEREKFIMLAAEEGLNAVSYGNGVTAKEAAMSFRDGQGDTLVGTAANYSEGVDLPRQMAPVIFFLRPSYPNPRDASTQFEERRFGNARWALWNWRVMMQALQVRGRNVRSRSDVGVTFFISQQFKRVLYAALPDWLEPAYRRQFTLDQAIADAEALLSSTE